MPVSSVTNRASFQGNGTSAVFSFAYKFFQQSDLGVIVYNSTISQFVTPMLLNGGGGTGFAISGNTDQSGIYPSGANVIFNSAPNAQSVVVIFRSSIVTNTFSVPISGAIPSTGLNNEFDYLTLISQRLQDQITRSSRLHDGYPGAFDPTLPLNLDQRPGKYLIVNSSGTGWDVGDTLGGGYIPNTLIYASGTSVVGSLPGAPAGMILQSQGSSAPTWTTVSFGSGLVPSTSITGVLSVPQGGTGNSNWIASALFFASSAQVFGQLGLGGTDVPLLGNTGDKPSFRAIPLASGSSVSGILPVPSGGTGTGTSYIQYGVLFASSATQVANTLAGGGDQPLVGSPGAAPSFKPLNLASGSSVTGTLPTALGGTGQTLWSANQVVLAGTATQLQGVTWGAPGTVLTSQGSSAPTWGAITTSPTAPTTVSANYTALISDQVVLCNSSNYTITLYNPSGNSGRQITLKKQNKTGPGITIVGSNSFIDGSSVVLDFQYESIVLTNDGSSWYALDRYQPAPQINLVTSGSGAWSAVYALGTYYKTGDGAWRLKLNMQGTSNSLNVVTVILASTAFGVAIGLGERQSLNANDNGAGSAPFNIFAPGSGGSSSISVQFAGAAVNRTVFGDVALLSKPGYQM